MLITRPLQRSCRRYKATSRQSLELCSGYFLLLYAGFSLTYIKIGAIQCNDDTQIHDGLMG